MNTVGVVFSLYLVNALSPGPNMVLIMQTAVSQGRRHALAISFGVTSGSFVLAVVAMLGLHVFLREFPLIAEGLRGICVGYLIILGARMWHGAAQPLPEVALSARAIWASWRRGFITVVTNPQTTLFFAGIIAAAVPPDQNGRVKGACIVAIVMTSVFWHGGFAASISGTSMRRMMARVKPAVDRVLAVLIVVFAMRLLTAGVA